MRQPVNTFNSNVITWVLLFLILKIAVIVLLPLTGDEAYFIGWGKDVSLGYYDHPPVVGWAIYVLSFISDSYYLLRFFALLVSIVISLTIYRLIADYKSNEVAFYVALIFFVSPLSLFSSILSNDTVLLLFGFVGFYFYSSALSKSSMVMAIPAGVFLGLAFLSKYLSVIMLAALLLYALSNWKKENFKPVLIMLLIVLAFIGENIYFNINNCWNNIVFNLVARTEGSSFDPAYIGLFILSLLFLVPPQGAYLLFKTKFENCPDFIRQALYVTIMFLVGFFIVSSFKKIGLHWLALYIPFIYLLFANLPEKNLPSLFKYNAIVSIIVSLVLLLISTQYNWLFAGHKKYNDILFYAETHKICDQLPKSEMILTFGYSKNSVLSQHCKNNEFHVMFNKSKYGREDDKKIVFSQYDDKTIYLLSTKQNKLKEIQPYFDNLDVSPIRLNQQDRYYLIKASGFKYDKYRDEILTKISRKYYTPPDWLPVSQCEFNDKYSL